MEGYSKYEHFDEILSALLPDVKKNECPLDPMELFAQFNYLTETEFAYLVDLSKEQSSQILTELQEQNKIELHVKKNGVIWKCRAGLLL